MIKWFLSGWLLLVRVEQLCIINEDIVLFYSQSLCYIDSHVIIDSLFLVSMMNCSHIRIRFSLRITVVWCLQIPLQKCIWQCMLRHTITCRFTSLKFKFDIIDVIATTLPPPLWKTIVDGLKKWVCHIEYNEESILWVFPYEKDTN